MTSFLHRLTPLLFCLGLATAPGLANAQVHTPSSPGPASSSTTSADPDAVINATPSTEAERPATQAAPPSLQRAGDDLAPYNPLDTYSFYLTALFIGFGLVVILLQLAAMRRIKTVTPDEIARNCAITLVVVASVALLVSGYSSQQVAPAFGLFGTIIGYLLGKAGAKEEKKPEGAENDPV
ncbi:hypothetical protein BH10PSE4_BH10PSE4_37030 [soil metagenome]